MAGKIVAGTGIVFPEMQEIRALLRDYPKSIRRKYTKKAFNEVTKPAMRALRAATPRGPTGNLKKAVTKKAHPNYAIVGYARSKKKDDEDAKGFHQNLLEYGGRKVRRTKGRVASTFGSKAKPRSGKIEIRTAASGKLKTLGPRFPKGFFKTAKAGERVLLGKMPVGGRTGVPPIRTAFKKAQPEVTSVLKQQMATVLERANKDMARRARPK